MSGGSRRDSRDKSVKSSPQLEERRCQLRRGGYDRPVAESDGTLQEQLEEIRTQLGWVRDYL
jgi:hypothetical protein